MQDLNSLTEISKLGLSDKEAQKRLLEHGENKLLNSSHKNLLNISIEICTEPMFILLSACAALYLILGDLDEALILSGFVIVIIGITIFQSWKTEKALSALKDLSSPQARVIRNGREEIIPSSSLVPGDIVVLNEGDKISADAEILSAINLHVDESTLTGESIPVLKSAKGEAYEDDENAEIEASQQCRVFSGSLVTNGSAYIRITATGMNTQLGKIGGALKSIDKGNSHFQREISILVNTMLGIALSLSLVIVIIIGFRESWIKGILNSISFAIAMLPEEIPAVFTIFMALGAYRISQKKVLTRKMSAIETLGSITVLCSDKTGTITENKMVLAELYTDTAYKVNAEAIPEKYHQLIEYAILASKEESFDPMENALKAVFKDEKVDSEHLHNWKFIKEYTLTKELLAMSRAWDDGNGELYSFYAKGSPEAIIDLCHLEQSKADHILKQLETMANKGLRVLAVAKSSSKLNYLQALQHDIDFEFIGLLGFLDPIRDGVKKAVEECHRAGIKLMMITGDYHVTAQHIAQEIGLKNSDDYLSGSDLGKLSDEELKALIPKISIFSRVKPEQKLRIVKALKNNDEVIAMTGDGVNDAPALKASDVGIAMGKAGTNVAREAADLVLLNDDFPAIISAIREGRRIFDNLRKATSYILAVHIPIAGLTLIPVIFAGLPVIFYPVHVAFLELIIDPTCSVVFESEPAVKDIMKRRPRQRDEAILDRTRILISIVQGLSVLAGVILVYFSCLNLGRSEAETRFLSFFTLVIGNFILTLINRSSLKPQKSLVVVFLVVCLSLVLIMAVPYLKKMFYFS